MPSGHLQEIATINAISPPIGENFSHCFITRQLVQLVLFFSCCEASSMRYSFILVPLCLFATVSSVEMTDPTSRLIVDGSISNVRDYPYSIRLILISDINGSSQSTCSGTILSPRWIVTAAHCLTTYEPIAAKIWVGINDVSDSGQIRNAELKVCHPNYDNSFLSENDICLLKTHDVLKFDITVQPAKLPGEDDNNYQNANVSGWGIIYMDGEKYKISFHLRTALMSIGSDFRCKRDFLGYNNVTNICLFHISQGSGGVCRGDSGSGFVVRRNDGSPVILGLVSGGKKCGIHVIGPRMSAYIEWIKLVMKTYS